MVIGTPVAAVRSIAPSADQSTSVVVQVSGLAAGTADLPSGHELTDVLTGLEVSTKLKPAPPSR